MTNKLKILLMMLPFITMSTTPTTFTVFTLFSTSMMSMTMLTMNQKMNSMNSSWLSTDSTAIMLILLTMFTMMLISLSSSSFKKMIKLILTISTILMIAFSLSDMMMFYIFFEMVLIPTFILISKHGKQPERLQASIYLLIYTITASLPLLLMILNMKNMANFLYLQTIMFQLPMSILALMAFLVKMPMFFTHLWLPKAHVEAPLEGSMILAAILLKLGSYGLIRLIPLTKHHLHNMSHWLVSISLLGSMYTTMICIQQKDTKAMIAYSSVAHMALIISTLFSSKTMSHESSMMMMIGHGMTSSALFFLMSIIFNQTHSRNLILFKGLINYMPSLNMWLFLTLSANIATPPTMNLMSEMLMITSTLQWSYLTTPPMMMTSFMTTTFSMYLYTTISHNSPHFKPKNTTMHKKTFLSLLLHLTPLVLLTMKLEMMHI